MSKIPQTKQNRKYWESRKELERAYIEQRLADDEKFNAELQKRFDRVQTEMQRNIELELYRLSEKNEIDISKVRGVVSQADIKEMEAYAKQVVEKARKLYKELGRPLSQDDFTKEVNDRMRLYNATMRINRLELIKSKIGMQTVDLGLDVNADILRKLNQDYQDQIERQAGIMGDAVPNLTNQELKNAVKSVIATTGGVSFSKRVWGDMDGLKAELDVQLVNSLVQGQSASVIAKNLLPFVSEKFQNKRYAAERIARTESARVDTDATLASLKKYGYKYCQWHDETKACDTCMAIARSNPTGYGQGVYEVDDVPYLPAHPNCRCSISAYWVDENKIEKEKIIKYGDVNFLEASKVNTNELISHFNRKNLKQVVDFVKENKDYVSGRLEDRGNTQRIFYKLAKDVGYDSPPQILPQKEFDKIPREKVIKRHLSKEREHYLLHGDLEYSINSVWGKGIYFGNSKSDINGYNKDGYTTVYATMSNNAKLFDMVEASKAIRSLVKSEPDLIDELGSLNFSKGVGSKNLVNVIAMQNGFDGGVQEKLGYVVVFNRKKMVFRDVE